MIWELGLRIWCFMWHNRVLRFDLGVNRMRHYCPRCHRWRWL